MKVIPASYEILTNISDGGLKELKTIEKIGRVCYKSEDRIAEDGESAKKFVKMLINRGHEAMLEHVSITVKFTCDRGISHEIVRHRLCSFAQESTRYVNYSSEKKAPDGIIFIKPCFFESTSEEYRDWYVAMRDAETYYFRLISLGCKPEEARLVLPMSVKTEVDVTANMREWRNIFKLRCDKAAHPQMRELMVPLLADMREKIPIIFDDINVSCGECPYYSSCEDYCMKHNKTTMRDWSCMRDNLKKEK